MVKTMNKELLLRLPQSIYEQLRAAADNEYKSMAAIIRETLMEKFDDTFSATQLEEIESQRKEFYEGKGTNWRNIKRG